MMGVVTRMAGTQEWLHQVSLLILLVAILILYNKNVLCT